MVQVVSIRVEEQKVKVLGSDFECLASEIHPRWNAEGGGEFSGQHEIFWRAVVPPFGIKIFFLLPENRFPSCPVAKMAGVESFNSPENFVCPAGYVCKTGGKGEGAVSIKNKYFRLTVDVSTGLLTQIQVRQQMLFFLFEKNKKSSFLKFVLYSILFHWH